jgi:hypothetical protein
LKPELLGAAAFNVAGVNVYVAAASFSRRLGRDEVRVLADTIPSEVLAAFLSTARLSLCKAALAYVYVLEDRELGTVRVRDDNIHFLLYMTGERQVRDAVQAAEPYEAVVLASQVKELVEEALYNLGFTGKPRWRADARCMPSEIEEVTLHRLRLLAK